MEVHFAAVFPLIAHQVFAADCNLGVDQTVKSDLAAQFVNIVDQCLGQTVQHLGETVAVKTVVLIAHLLRISTAMAKGMSYTTHMKLDNGTKKQKLMHMNKKSFRYKMNSRGTELKCLKEHHIIL